MISLDESVPNASMRPVCLFIPSFGDGGTERMMVNLARGIVEQGLPVDFVTNNHRVPFLDQLPDSVKLYRLSVQTLGEREGWMCEFVARRRPTVVLTTRLMDDEVALTAKHHVGGDTRFFLRPGFLMAEGSFDRRENMLRRWWDMRRLRALYRQADGVIAVSQGVADSVLSLARISPDKVRVIRNPVLGPDLQEQAREPVDHPWFAPGQPPVILGLGGLRTQKDFSSLIAAFARMRRRQPCRLMILGEGPLRQELQQQVAELGLEDEVTLPGFDPNPYRYLSRARMLVSSSLWEGSPNVLVEALALGVPVVATDCQSGPREITRNERFGSLVPVGNIDALANAMADTLRNPPDAAMLRSAVSEYEVETSVKRYLQVFGYSEGISPRTFAV